MVAVNKKPQLELNDGQLNDNNHTHYPSVILTHQINRSDSTDVMCATTTTTKQQNPTSRYSIHNFLFRPIYWDSQNDICYFSPNETKMIKEIMYLVKHDKALLDKKLQFIVMVFSLSEHRTRFICFYRFGFYFECRIRIMNFRTHTFSSSTKCDYS